MSKGLMLLGDAWSTLQTLTVEGGIDLCITSPPYWGLRDYGIDTWKGGDSECDHIARRQGSGLRNDGRKHKGLYNGEKATKLASPYRGFCGKCGAVRTDIQLGLEQHYNDYLIKLCDIFEQVKSHFTPQSNLVVNIGDCYFSRSRGTGGPSKKQDSNKGSRFDTLKLPPIMSQGSLVGIPARFAIKMVDEYGWVLKHDIIWHKPNTMPTSNKKKFTIDYEHVYHFVLDTKKYYFKQQFEPFSEDTIKTYKRKIERLQQITIAEQDEKEKHYKHNDARISSQESPNRMWEDIKSLKRQLRRGRNKRSVWSIPTLGYDGSHAATYPRDLIRVPIDAMCPEGGIILDPFMGAGTTAIEAEAQDKYWIGIELNKEYYDDAIRRIENERTGND